MRKRIISILLTACLLVGLLPTVPLAAESDAWDGTTVNTSWYNINDISFSITTAAELAGLAQIVNGTAGGISQDSFIGKTITLSADIDLNQKSWTPIGTAENPFKGKFDGNNLSIKNLNINSTGNNQGLFGYIEDAEVCNVTLNEVIVLGDTNIGGIAGVAVNSIIKECKLVNNSEPNTTTHWGICGSESVGGIVGSSQDSRIMNCTNNAYVYLLTTAGNPARHKLGGIVGVATLSSDTCSEEDAVLIIDCTNTGNINCTTKEDYECTGGIVGRLVSDNAVYRAIVKNCNNSGEVYSIEAGTGGIVGYAQNASIEGCGNTNSVRGNIGVGGIAGYAYYGTQILNCTNSGSVMGRKDTDDDTGNTVYPCNIGGIVGSIYNPRDTSHLEGDCNTTPVYSYNRDSLISNCNNSGAVTCNYDWPEAEPIIYPVNGVPYAVNISGSFIGGIAGFAVDSAYFEEEGNVIRIENCTNTGTVTGKTYSGGVLGVGKNVDVVGCTNTGTVTDAGNSDSDSIREDIGGYSYTVWFDANGGAVKPEDTLKIAVYGVLDSLPVPTRDGYTLDCWKFGDVVVTAQTDYCVLASPSAVTNIELKAQWIDTAAPVISGVENGKNYCTARTVTVYDNETIQSVTVNGSPVSLDANNQFTLNRADGTQAIVATDGAGNVSAEMIVTVNNGHTDENKDHLCDSCGVTLSNHSGGEATCMKKAVCDYCGNEYGDLDKSKHNVNNIPAKDATVTETGNKEYWHCDDCGANFSDKDGKSYIGFDDAVTAKLSPEIIEGVGQSLNTGEKRELTFRSNAAFIDFIQVEFDGKILDGNNYTVNEGSTIVTLKADYVATLSAGEHTIGIVSTSGTATTTFTINANSPETGDNSHMALWITLFFVSGGILTITGIYFSWRDTDKIKSAKHAGTK